MQQNTPTSHDAGSDLPPESTSIEHQLAAFLEELTSVQDELLDVLTAKRDRIAENDLEGAASLQPNTEQLCDRLEACHTRRAELLAESANDGYQPATLGDLAASIDSRKTGILSKQVNAVSTRTRLLQHHSLTNWVLAQRSILHLSQLLEIIATGGQLQPTYGSDTNSHSGGSLVDREA